MKPSIVVHICNPSPQEDEAGKQWVPSQPGLHSTKKKKKLNVVRNVFCIKIGNSMIQKVASSEKADYETSRTKIWEKKSCVWIQEPTKVTLGKWSTVFLYGQCRYFSIQLAPSHTDQRIAISLWKGYLNSFILLKREKVVFPLMESICT